MRFTSLPKLEEKVLATGNEREFELKRIAVPVKTEQLTLQGYLCTPLHRSQYYYAVEHAKERIVLHYTAGQIRSDLATLTRQSYHVSVPFVIARDGTIYQLFSSKYWSGHIGKGLGNIDTGNAQDKKSIGIELSNYGFLTEKDGNLETCYSRMKAANGQTGPVDIYCSLSEKEAYQKLSKPFRGESYYASYTEPQYESLIILLRYLTIQYNIPRKFLPEDVRFVTTDQTLTFKGIVSHVNFRKDGKWDLGPAFDWKKVVNGVSSATFTPRYQKPVPVFRDGKVNAVTSEEDLDEFLPDPKDASKQDEEYDN